MTAPVKLPRALKLIKVGDSYGVVLPRDVLTKLGLELGDTLDVTDIPGGIHIRRHDDGFAVQMAAAREVMQRRRNALRELAK